MIEVKEILSRLPEFKNEVVLITENQAVKDIIKSILNSHEKHAALYNRFALLFDDNDIETICTNLHEFIKSNIKYKEESEDQQTTGLPTYFLTMGKGDCKHYSLFSGGVLDAIHRLTGKKINWCYRFCSYQLFNKTPHHVFIVVKDGDKEYWIDPVPGANKLTPVWQLDKTIKAKNMALYEVIGNTGFEGGEDQLPASTIQAVETLKSYGLVFMDGQIDYDKLNKLVTTLPQDQAKQIYQAIETITADAVAIGGFFRDVAHGIAKVTLSIPRNAYLLMLRFNVKGWATKIMKIWQHGTKEDGDKLYNKWYNLGGSWDALAKAVEAGYQKRSLGNVVGMTGAEVTAALAAAAPIIAAIVPLVMKLLDGIQQPQVPGTLPPIVPGEGGYQPVTGEEGGLLSGRNLLLIGGAGAAIYFLTRKKKVGAARSNNLLPLVLLGGGVLFLASRKGDTTPVVEPEPGTEPGTAPNVLPGENTPVYTPTPSVRDLLDAALIKTQPNVYQQPVIEPVELPAYRDQSLYTERELYGTDTTKNFILYNQNEYIKDESAPQPQTVYSI